MATKAEGAKVSKVEVQIGGKTINLTLAQVKELRDALNEIFGEKVVEKHIHHHDWWRRPWVYLNSDRPSVRSPNIIHNAKREALTFCVK